MQVKPAFPRRALEDGIEHGRVLLRLHLEPDGRVGAVSVLEASPAGYFEAASRQAALQFKCLPGTEAGATLVVPFLFRQE